MQLIKEPFSIIFKNKIIYEGSKLLVLFSLKITCTYLSISDLKKKKLLLNYNFFFSNKIMSQLIDLIDYPCSLLK